MHAIFSGYSSLWRKYKVQVVADSGTVWPFFRALPHGDLCPARPCGSRKFAATLVRPDRRAEAKLPRNLQAGVESARGRGARPVGCAAGSGFRPSTSLQSGDGGSARTLLPRLSGDCMSAGCIAPRTKPPYEGALPQLGRAAVRTAGRRAWRAHVITPQRNHVRAARCRQLAPGLNTIAQRGLNTIAQRRRCAAPRSPPRRSS